MDRPLSRQARGRRADRPHHQRRARAHLARAADVPALRPPPGHRLARAQRRIAHLGRNRERRRRRAVGDASRSEAAAARVCAPPRGGTGRAPRRIARNLAKAQPRAEPGCADHRICAPLRHLQARQLDPGRYREAGVDGERSQAPGAVRLRRQGASARRTRQARLAADRGVDARSAILPTNSFSSKTTTSTSDGTSCRASMCG